jgi:hypothetical protein
MQIKGASDFAVEYSTLSRESDLNHGRMLEVRMEEMLGTVEGTPSGHEGAHPWPWLFTLYSLSAR